MTVISSYPSPPIVYSQKLVTTMMMIINIHHTLHACNVSMSSSHSSFSITRRYAHNFFRGLGWWIWGFYIEYGPIFLQFQVFKSKNSFEVCPRKPPPPN